MSKLYHASSSNSCKNLFFGTFFTNKSPNANQYANAGNTSNGRNKHSVSVAITNPIQIAGIKKAYVAFFLLCVFLGMGGTFWLRCNSRREEMGIYMTMGSTRHRLIRQFLLEAWWMVTIAFVIGALAQFQIVYLNGFAFAPDDPNPDYIQNRPVLHFLIVSAISYILILAVSFVATYIPVSKAARMNPADALRDE